MNPMKALLTLAALACFPAFSCGDPGKAGADPKVVAGIKADIEKVVGAVFSGDIDTVAKHTHDKVIAIVGTKEEFLAEMKKVFKQLEAIELVSVDVGEEMDFFSTDERDFVIVPASITMKIAGEEQDPAAGYQLGVKERGETIWKYIDCSSLTTEKAREWFADFPKDKAIPVPAQ